jgi:hypothetical protein
MNIQEMMRREILRLTEATHSAFIHTQRLSALYNMPEKSVRQEIATLAAENRIRLAGWLNKDEFLEKAPAGVAVRVDLVD